MQFLSVRPAIRSTHGQRVYVVICVESAGRSRHSPVLFAQWSSNTSSLCSDISETFMILHPQWIAFSFYLVLFLEFRIMLMFCDKTCVKPFFIKVSFLCSCFVSTPWFFQHVAVYSCLCRASSEAAINCSVLEESCSYGRFSLLFCPSNKNGKVKT